MKNRTKILLVAVAVIFMGQTVFSQQSVKDATEYAKKLAKKVKKSSLKKFAKAYPTALADIKKIEDAAQTEEFGYDAVADNANSWKYLNEKLKKSFGDGPVTFKDLSVDLHYKDYSTLQEEARAKAAKAHFDAGEKITTGTKNYTERIKAIDHFKLAFKYTNQAKEKENTPYLSKINGYISSIYYDEGVRIFTSSPNDLEQLKTAKKTLLKIEKYDKEYKDWKAKYDAVCKAGAEILYKKASEQEKTLLTFKGQSKAAFTYREIKYWVENYKDSKERSAICDGRAYPQVLFVDNDGKVIPGDDLRGRSDNLRVDQNIPQRIKVNTGDDFKEWDMTKPENQEKAKTGKYAYGFIIVKASDKKGPVTYKNNGITKTTKTVGKYYISEKNKETGKWEKKSVTKTDFESTFKIYNKGKEILSDSKAKEYLVGGVKFEKNEGTVTTFTESAKASCEVYLEIWDFRGNGAAKKINTITSKLTSIDKISWETYDGDPSVKPSLKEKSGKLKTEAVLKEEVAKKAIPSVKEFVADNKNSVAKAITVDFK
ncbi:MAG: hypothetical protein ABFS35_23690 [Bacteroidota bacterium]